VSREIFYEYSASAIPPDPDANSTKYTGALPYANGYYKAIAKEGNDWSSVTSKSFGIPWTPANITTALWLDANDLTTITKDGANLVSQWNDKSGNSRNATASGTARPLWGSSNIILNGVDKKMSVSAYSNQPNISIFVVASNERSPLPAKILDAIVSFAPLISGKGIAIHSANSYFSTTQRFLAVEPVISGSKSFWVNGQNLSDHITLSTKFSASVVYVGVPINVNNIFNIGFFNNGSTSFFGKNNINEIITTHTTADTTTRQKIEGYLAWKWDTINGNTTLVTALPSDHPYKSQVPAN